MARLQETYAKEIAPALMKKFNYKSVMEVPHVDKIVINMGLSASNTFYFNISYLNLILFSLLLSTRSIALGNAGAIISSVVANLPYSEITKNPLINSKSI